MKKLWYLVSLLYATTCWQSMAHAVPGYYPRGMYPDFSRFKTIHLHEGMHFQPAFPGSTAVFWFFTPDKINCVASEYGAVTCFKAPHTPYKTINGKPSSSKFKIAIESNSSSVYATGKPINGSESPGEGYAMVPGTKFTLGDTTCAVGTNHLFSCKQGNHGFVLQTTGDSWLI